MLYKCPLLTLLCPHPDSFAVQDWNSSAAHSQLTLVDEPLSQDDCSYQSKESLKHSLVQPRLGPISAPSLDQVLAS
jgi:hypothetical protein